MGLPCRPRRAVQFLYKDVHVRFLLNGRMSEKSVCVSNGIKQGCPPSGPLWAVLYDPVVRAIYSSLPSHDLVARCVADVLVAAVFRIHQSFPHVVRCFEQVRRAARLRLTIKKTELIYFGMRSFAEVSAEMATAAAGERMVVSGRRGYLGVPIGLDRGRVLGQGHIQNPARYQAHWRATHHSCRQGSHVPGLR